MLLTRRHLLLGIGSSLVASKISAAEKSCADTPQITYSPEKKFLVEGDEALKVRASNRRIIFGAYSELGYQTLSQDQSFRDAMIRECNLLVGHFLWGRNRPTPEEFNFDDLDAVYTFALDQKMLFQGMTLVWHIFIPQWLEDIFNRTETSVQDLQNILVKSISTTVKRYNKAYSWIVVNEAIEPTDGREDGLRITPWLSHLGADYIELAFRTAAEANPEALLIYNEYGLEHDSPTDEARRSATLKLLEHLKSKDVPIHALGIQSHLVGHQYNSSFNGLRCFLKSVSDLGLKVMITELDVSDEQLPADITLRDHQVAAVYENYLSAVLSEPAVVAVLSWGLSDRYTWLSAEDARSDGLPLRPLPLDEFMNRKLAWNAIARAIDACPDRQVGV
jgi:endo-1,4-beta-xylanase